MRLLLLNPNTSDFITATVLAQARCVAAPDTEITAVTGTFGARVIATRTEQAIAEHATLDALAHHADDYDAVVLAVSYDTALLAAREMLGIPVIGITQAALLTACMLGTRIGVVMFGKRVLALYQEIAAHQGMAARIAGWRSIEHTAPYSQGDQTESDSLLVNAVNSLVDTEACEVVVLAGAVMAGVPQRLQSRVSVPLLDGVSCAIPHAEMLVRLGLPKAQTGSLAPLTARELVGVSDALRGRFR